MAKATLIRSCVITGTTFGICHFVYGIFVYLFVIGISKLSTLAIFCALIFIFISIVLYIIGCQQFCTLNERQSPYLISSATSSLFASLSCFYVNAKWLASSNPINRIPFFLIIIASLFLTFTSTFATLFKFLNFNGILPSFQKQGTIMGKFICDLITSLILSFIIGFTYSEESKSSKTVLTVFLMFGIIPCLLYTIAGCLLECYAQNAEDIADPLAQI